MSEPRLQLADAEIAKRMSNGDQGALEELLRLHGGKVREYLWRRFKDVADDAFWVAADKGWRSASTYDSRKGALGAWFLRIAQHAALDLLRGEDPHRHAPLEDAGAAEVADTVGPKEERKDDAERLERLEADVEEVLAPLPPQQQRIARADLAAGEAANAQALARELQTSVASIYTSRSKERVKIEEGLRKRGYG